MSTWMERFRFGTAHMWSAVMEPRGRRSIKSARKRRRAVEKPEPWKLWKTNPRFSTVPTAPWKSRKGGGISTFPQLRRLLPISHPQQEKPLPQAEGAQQGRSGEPDSSRVNKTGQIEKLTTGGIARQGELHAHGALFRASLLEAGSWTYNASQA